ncbi:MAG TPA: DUF362 domain-containing protein [Patescibacteria group bacterium]|nr:DUF362 domain-containing protein [Patescibacteria group bacterium]
MKKKSITRRDFMRQGALAVVGTAAGLSSLPLIPQEQKSRVILIRRQAVLDENLKIDEKILQEMLDQALMSLFKKEDAAKAFQSIIKADDVVGIKTNVWNYLPTPPELENAIKRRVLAAGVKEENIDINDREVIVRPVFQKATALINARPLRTHYLAGISGCMKNYITFAKNIPDYHPNTCEDLALLFSLPQVKGKTRLHVLSVLTPQFHAKGPHHFDRRYVWTYNGLLVGTDPVAIDAIALMLVTAKRLEVFGPRESRVMPYPRSIAAADAKHKLGTSDINKIDLVKLGWQEGILI